MPLSGVKTVIFDFDGTIAQTLDAMVAAANRIFVEEGREPVTDIEPLRDLGLQDVLRTLKIPLIMVPIYAPRMMAYFGEEMRTAKIVPGIDKAIAALRSRFKIGIMTSNSAQNVRRLMGDTPLDFLSEQAAIFGKHHRLQALLLTKGLRAEDTVYVGDELRDIEACRKAHVRVIAVTWGYNTEKALASGKPDFLVHKPADLVKLFGVKA
jgi:phosphoglycolate phosphatase